MLFGCQVNETSSWGKPKGLIRYTNSKDIMYEEEEGNARLQQRKAGTHPLIWAHSAGLHHILVELLK